MSTNITTYKQGLPPAPARMQQQMAQAQEIVKGFTDGIRDSFPTVSFKGGKWAVKFQGVSSPIKTPDGYPSPYFDVVLIEASNQLSKIFYNRQYSEGDISPPDCFSVNGIAPDPASPLRQSATCGACKQNVFGSRITSTGKQGKACQDNRRVVVIVPHAPQLGPIMLRVPYSGLKPLKEYVQMLLQHGYEPGGCITRMTFGPDAAYPLLQFSFHLPVSDTLYDAVLDMRANDDRLERILEMPIDEAMSEAIDPAMQNSIGQTAQGQGYAQPPQQPQQHAPVQQPVYQPPMQHAPVQPMYQSAPTNAFSPPAQQQAPVNGFQLPEGAPAPGAAPTRRRQRQAAAPVGQPAPQPQQQQAPIQQAPPQPQGAPPANAFSPPSQQNQTPPADAFSPPAQQQAPVTPGGNGAAPMQTMQAPPELEAALSQIMAGGQPQQ